MKRRTRRNLNVAHRRLRRIQNNCLAENLGGRQAAEDLRARAQELRIKGGACAHGDDERVYLSEAEADADNRPAHCPICNKPKLVVKIISKTGATEPGMERARELLVRGILK